MEEGADVLTLPREGRGAGERPPFEGFFEEHHRDLYGAMWLITRNRHEAEEIVQEAFVRAWERWDRVGVMDDPAGYVYRTAMNVFRSRYRRARTALRRFVESRDEKDLLLQVEDRQEVTALLDRLTRRQRAAIVLVELLGYTSEEAAKLLRVRPSTVRVLAARGRAALVREVRDPDDQRA